jgi:hypothetical protein
MSLAVPTQKGHTGIMTGEDIHYYSWGEGGGAVRR